MSFMRSEVKLDESSPGDLPVHARHDSLAHHPRTFDVLRIYGAVKDLSSRIFGGDIEALTNIHEKERLREQILHNASRSAREFASKDGPTVCWELGVTAERGLTAKEVQARAAKVGHNELEHDELPGFWALLACQFRDLLVWILIAAVIAAMSLGEIAAGLIVVFIICFNAALGVKMEMGAGQALEALQNSNPPTSEVRRDGSIKEVPSRDLVPGDIVILGLGKKVPADIRLLKSASLASNEMQLTGESEPVKKSADYLAQSDAKRIADSELTTTSLPSALDRLEDPKEKEREVDEDDQEKATTFKNMVYMGSAIQDGNGEGVVVHIGMHTAMGEIAHLLSNADEGESPLQRKLDRMGQRLGFLALFVSSIVYTIGVLLNRGPGHSNESIYLQMLLVAVSLTVAAIPEALPVVVTICLARGMSVMAKDHQAQILKLKSVETLGSASVICTDKTGTLTKGEMTAVKMWYAGQTYRFTGTGFDPNGYCIPEDVDARDDKACQTAASEIKASAHRSALLLSTLCSNATLQYDDVHGKWETKGNSSERPLVVAARKCGINKPEVDKLFLRIKENAFSSTRKMMSTVHVINHGHEFNWFGEATHISCVKGAPNYILQSAVAITTMEWNGPTLQSRPLDQKEKDSILKVIDEFSSQALRVLAVAYRLFNSAPGQSIEEVESKLVFCGLICSMDPEREEVAPSIAKAFEAGVRTVMITGDYVATAKAIGENVGILPKGSPADKAVDCEQLRALGDEEDKLMKRLADLEAKLPAKPVGAKLRGRDHQERALTPEQQAVMREAKEIKDQLIALEKTLDELTNYADVYARALPRDKITIVRSLQRQGHVCSMTGDGVNDAPALRQANIGVAMGVTGTDVAKAAAAMILLNDSFASIIAAIEQGRITYANIQKFIFFLLSNNISEVMLILVAVVVGLKAPLVPVQILWLNLTTDICPALALAFEKMEPGVMKEGPRPVNEPILEKMLIIGIVYQVILLTCTSLGTYIFGLTEFAGTWDGSNPGNLTEDELDSANRKAQTMCMVTLIFAELWRAFTVRSMRISIFTLGVFSNRLLAPAVAVAISLTILMANIPGLMDTVFGLDYLPGRAWAWCFFISFIPAVVEECVKLVYRRTGFGLRRNALLTRKCAARPGTAVSTVLSAPHTRIDLVLEEDFKTRP